MKTSKWLQQYEKEVSGKRNKSNNNKKIIIFIIPAMFILAMIPALTNGSIDAQTQTGIYAMVGVFVFIMVFVIFMMSKGKKIDAAKETRENVTALLQTNEQIERFDAQMSRSPLMEVVISNVSKIFVTEDYVGMTYLHLGDLQYHFENRSNIAGIDYTKTASMGANPARASYFFDVKNANNQELFGSAADTGEQLEQMIALMRNINPNLIITEK